MNFLSCVTLTGVDSHTNLQTLMNLTHAYPFVEWGVLYSSTRGGKDARYPTGEEALHIVDRLANHGCQVAVHMCGRAVRDVLDGQDPVAEELAERAGRVQLNFNQRRDPVSMTLLHDWISKRTRPVITQYNDANSTVWTEALHPRHHVLFDASGGRGVETTTWPAPLGDLMCGYAGGMGPKNVTGVLQSLHATATRPFWIDMEQRLRDEHDQFDLTRCKSVLEQVDFLMAQSTQSK